MRFIQFCLVSIIFILPVGFIAGCFPYSSRMDIPLFEKSLPKMHCKENERIIVQVYPVEKSITAKGQPTLPQSVAHDSEFEQEVANILGKTDYQVFLLSHIEQHLNRRSSCAMMYLTWHDRQQIVLQPSDKVISITLFLFYELHGDRRPIMDAMLNWNLVTDVANMPVIDQSEAEIRKLHEELKAQPDDKKKQDRLFSIFSKTWRYYDAYDRLDYISPAYSRTDWLADDGKLIEQEMNTAIDQLTAQLANVLFPEKQTK